MFDAKAQQLKSTMDLKPIYMLFSSKATYINLT